MLGDVSVLHALDDAVPFVANVDEPVSGVPVLTRILALISNHRLPLYICRNHETISERVERNNSLVPETQSDVRLSANGYILKSKWHK